MDRRQADLPLDPRRLRNDDLNHRRGGYGRDRRRPPRSRSRIYLISPRGTTVPRQRVRPTVALPLFLLHLHRSLILSLVRSRIRTILTSVSQLFSFRPRSQSSTPVLCHPFPSQVFTYTRIREETRECAPGYIPMLIKRNTDPRYLSHARRWRPATRSDIHS